MPNYKEDFMKTKKLLSTFFLSLLLISGSSTFAGGIEQQQEQQDQGEQRQEEQRQEKAKTVDELQFSDFPTNNTYLKYKESNKLIEKFIDECENGPVNHQIKMVNPQLFCDCTFYKVEENSRSMNVQFPESTNAYLDAGAIQEKLLKARPVPASEMEREEDLGKNIRLKYSTVNIVKGYYRSPIKTLTCKDVLEEQEYKVNGSFDRIKYCNILLKDIKPYKGTPAQEKFLKNEEKMGNKVWHPAKTEIIVTPNVMEAIDFFNNEG